MEEFQVLIEKGKVDVSKLKIENDVLKAAVDSL